MLTLLSLLPQTGEKPLSGWIIAIVIIAAILVLACAITPFLPKIIEFIKSKINDKKGKNDQ